MRELASAAVRGVAGLMCLYLVAIAAAALAFAAFEGRSLVDSVWWAFVTAMTIGYGDIYPASAGGRATAVLLMHFVPLFVIPLVTARLAARLIVNSDAFTHGEQEEIKAALREIRERLPLP